MGADEPEDMGVEHLLRDINDPSISSLANRIKRKMFALRTLQRKLEEMQTYLNAVLAGTIAKNNQILKKIQDIFNLIPNLTNAELAQAFLTKSNDMHLIIYLSSLVRALSRCTIWWTIKLNIRILMNSRTRKKRLRRRKMRSKRRQRNRRMWRRKHNAALCFLRLNIIVDAAAFCKR